MVTLVRLATNDNWAALQNVRGALTELIHDNVHMIQRPT